MSRILSYFVISGSMFLFFGGLGFLAASGSTEFRLLLGLIVGLFAALMVMFMLALCNAASIDMVHDDAEQMAALAKSAGSRADYFAGEYFKADRENKELRRCQKN